MMRVLLLLLALTLPGGAVLAKEQVVGMNERVFKIMGEAQELIDVEDYPGAREVLARGLERKLSNYERAHMLNITGYTWYEQEEMDRAIAAYEEARALEDLPNSMLVTLNLTLGQVNLVKEDYVAAEAALRRLIELPEQYLPNNLVLIAAALIGQDRHTEALEPLIEAIETKDAAGEQVRENWLSMLSSVYYEMNDFEAMRDVVERLVITFPREQYLLNLAALHGQLGDQQRQLALVESLLDDDRITTQSHLKMIVNLYLGENMPYKAARLLSQELESGRVETTVKNLELLSQAWYMSAELDKAIDPLAEAADRSESGELFLRLARLHMDAYRWEEANAAARRALDKGGLRQEGHAWLLRGMAEVRLKSFTEARQLFSRAADYDYTEKYAKQWLNYVDAEEARLNASS